MGSPEQNRGSYQRWRQRLREQIDGLKSQPCHDCGISYHPFVMDFDHRPGEGKGFNISAAIPLGISFSKILTEAAKCDVVCSNCHRMRTLTRKEAVKKPIPEALPHYRDRTKCVNGHDFTPENTRIRPPRNGRAHSRECRTCDNERARLRTKAKRAVPDTDDLLFAE